MPHKTSIKKNEGAWIIIRRVKYLVYEYMYKRMDAAPSKLCPC